MSPNTASERKASDQHFRTDHLIAGIGERTVRGGLVMMSAHGLKFTLSIVATAIMARLLEPQDYGLIGMVGVALNFVSLFKDMGLNFATIQRAEINFQQISTLFWINVSMSLLITMLTVAIAPIIAWFYGEPRLTMIAVVLAAGFIFGGLAVQHEALLRRQMRFFALSTIALASMIAGYTVGITLALSGFHYWALVYSQLALLAANMLGVLLVCRWRPGRPRLDLGMRSMLSFGGNITGYALINYFSKNSDNLLIGKFWGPQQLGFYNKALQLAGLPTDQVDEPLASVAIPALSRLGDSEVRYRQAYLRMLEKVMLLTTSVIAWMVVSSDWLVQVMLGKQWSLTGRILVFVGLAALFQPVINTVGWLFISQNRSRDMLRWATINAPISMLSILAGLPWGGIGVAASYCLTRILVVTPLAFWLVGRTGPVNTSDLCKRTAPFVLSSIMAILVCLAFRRFIHVGSPIVGLTTAVVLTSVTTLVVLLLIPAGRSALTDVTRTWGILRSKRLSTVSE